MSARPAKLAPGQVLIRRAEARDAQGLHALYAMPGVYSGTLHLPFPSEGEWQAKMQRAPDDVVVLVAEMDGQVVGNCTLNLAQRARRRHTAVLGVAVRDDFAGRGIGRLLMQEALRMADNWLGLLRIELTVFVDNQFAQNLYRQLGFVEEGRLRGYMLRDGVYADVLTMARLHPQQPLLSQRP